MNIRQKYKRAKAEKNLMWRIIAANEQMKELYDYYNQPRAITTVPVKQYVMQQTVPRESEPFLDIIKKQLAQKLFDACADDCITFTREDGYYTTIRASIFVGAKQGDI